ncbi:MAG: alpha-amylase family glycosyl hydrolase [Chloroflexota bacterium]|nr:alpha-amylase family glycosyl hydrolase [Chloroflexota bacterium]
MIEKLCVRQGFHVLLLVGLLLLAVACASQEDDEAGAFADVPAVEEVEPEAPEPPADVEVEEALEPEAEAEVELEGELDVEPEPELDPDLVRVGGPVSPIDLPPQGTDGFPWWNDTVWYEIFVRSFYDSDGDGVGDLQGIIQKLDYLNDGDPLTRDDLGVTGIWLMPIFESPSYHGYDVVDYYEVDEEYGTREDFRELMEEAHARGIRVIIDMVLNHTSAEHPWFEAALVGDPEYEDWYRFVEGEQPRQFAPWGGGNIWHPAGEDRYYYALYWEGMPDLNYRNEEVTEQMYDVTRFWLEEMGVDGFRLDGVAHLVEDERQVKNTEETHEWLAAYHAFVRELNPDAVLVGEVWYPTNEIAPYIVDDEVDLAFEFTTATNIIAAANTNTAGPVRIGYGLAKNLYPPLQYAPFLTNHDIDRIFSQLDGNMGEMRVAAAILLTGPGVPFLYYGEEVAMTGTKPDEDIRLPFPWTAGPNGGFTEGEPWRPLPAEYEEHNVEEMNADPDSLLNYYRSLIHLRNDHEALRIGEYFVLDSSSSDIFSFIRQSSNETLLIIHNLTSEPIEEYELELDEGILVEEGVPPELLHGDLVTPLEGSDEAALADYMPIETLEPYTSYVIQLRP